MLIEGKFKTFGFWLANIATFGGLILLFYFLFNENTTTPVARQIFLYLVIVLCISIYGKLLFDANFILIDTDTKIITFKNRFTRRKTTYKWSDFDGRLVIDEPVKGGWVRNYYLVKDKRALKKITAFMYSNQSEIEEALKEIKDLGTFKYSYLRSWKISLRLPILN
jgi:hypothetical protein